MSDALSLARADFAPIRGPRGRFPNAEYATTLPSSTDVGDCKIRPEQSGWTLDCALPMFANTQGASAVDAVARALPSCFVRQGTKQPVAMQPTWPFWTCKNDRTQVSLYGFAPTVRISIVQYEKVPSATSYDGSDVSVPIVWYQGEVDPKFAQPLGSGIVVAEDAEHSYVASAIPSLFVGRHMRVGDPLSRIRFQLMPAEIVARDDASTITIFRTSRLHVYPARLALEATPGRAVRLITHEHWDARMMGRTWVDPGDPPAPPLDFGLTQRDEDGRITKRTGGGERFEVAGTNTEWLSAAVIDAEGRAVIGLAGTRVAASDGGTLVWPASAIVRAMRQVGLAPRYADRTMNSAFAPAAAPAPTANVSLAAFMLRAVNLSHEDFASVRSAASLLNVPGSVEQCGVSQGIGGYWLLNCRLPQYTSRDGSMDVASFAAALPIGFVRSGPVAPSVGGPWPFWTRPEDDVQITLQPIFDTMHFWIAQVGKPYASGTVLDGATTPVPIITRSADSSGGSQLGTIGSGVVVAEDAAHAYVLAKIDTWALTETIKVGDPHSPGTWDVVDATIAVRDDLSGLSILQTRSLRVRPAVFARVPVQGQAVRVIFDEAQISSSSLTRWQARILSDAGFVGSVHRTPAIFEYTAGANLRWAGGTVVDASTGAVVGFPDATQKNTSGAYLAEPAEIVAHLAERAHVSLAYSEKRGDVSFAPLVASLARIGAGQERGSGILVAPGDAAAETSYILTADHVVRDPLTGNDRPVVTVFLPSVRHGVPARVVRSDQHNDLALLAIRHVDEPIPPIAPGVRRGQHVGVLGFPRSSYSFVEYDDAVVPKLNDGLVSVVDLRSGTIEYDALTDEGNSGGPVFDFDSHAIVGIVQGETSKGSGTYSGAGVAAIRAFLMKPK